VFTARYEPSPCITYVLLGHAVAQLVEASRYKPEGRGFDFQWLYRNFLFI
jgi:hypothetical protein